MKILLCSIRGEILSLRKKWENGRSSRGWQVVCGGSTSVPAPVRRDTDRQIRLTVYPPAKKRVSNDPRPAQAGLFFCPPALCGGSPPLSGKIGEIPARPDKRSPSFPSHANMRIKKIRPREEGGSDLLFLYIAGFFRYGPTLQPERRLVHYRLICSCDARFPIMGQVCSYGAGFKLWSLSGPDQRPSLPRARARSSASASRYVS